MSEQKSQFFKESVEFLGFTGVLTSPDKVKAIRDFKHPSNLLQLRSFLGRSLLLIQMLAFDKLRNILYSEEIVLHYPDYSKPFDLTTDASSTGISPVLSQGNRPITMISRTLKDRDVNYATNGP